MIIVLHKFIYHSLLIPFPKTYTACSININKDPINNCFHMHHNHTYSTSFSNYITLYIFLQKIVNVLFKYTGFPKNVHKQFEDISVIFSHYNDEHDKSLRIPMNKAYHADSLSCCDVEL